MVKCERTFDLPLVRATMTHRRIYPHVSDDGSPSADDFSPIDSPLVYYLAMDDGEHLGIFMLYPHNTVCFEVHTCLLPKAWGEKARQCTREGMHWMFENTSCRRIITNIPEYNRLALKLALDSGMSRFGTNPKSFMKNGTLYDQIMLGISKE